MTGTDWSFKPAASTAIGSSLVHSTIPSGVGAPLATPILNGFVLHPCLPQIAPGKPTRAIVEAIPWIICRRLIEGTAGVGVAAVRVISMREAI